jgi:hypothetical protein
MKLEYIDRGKLPGFIKYFKERQFRFQEVFKISYSEEEATKVFQEVNNLAKNMKDI